MSTITTGHRITMNGNNGHTWTEVSEPSGTYYPEGTPRPIVEALEAARVSGKRVRVFMGDTERPRFREVHHRDPIPGADWLDENGVSGYVGRTTGAVKSPILLPTRSSMGGGIIGADAIVRLLVDGREVYRHPGYAAPRILIEHEGMTTPGGAPYPSAPWAAYVNGGKEPHARFKTEAAAIRWAAFMRGERMTK